MRRFVRLSLFLVLLSSAALAASPAQNVFDEVSFYLQTQYGGFSKVNLRALPAQFQPKLEAACMDQANTCPATVAYPVILEMVKSIGDEHTNFYAASGVEIRELLNGTGKTSRFGITPTLLKTGVYVRDVAVESPAWGAGVRRADRIIALDGEPVPKDGAEFYKRWDAVNGAREPVLLSLSRSGQRLSLEITPSNLLPELPSLEVRADAVAVIRVPDFIGRGQGTVAPRIHALTLEAQKRAAKAIVVDLRDNGGGFDTECLGGVGAFVGDGVTHRLVSGQPLLNREARYSGGSVILKALGVERTVYTVNPAAQWTGAAAVLVNAHSASCAEFFAQDFLQATRGPVVGEPTFGVGNTATLFNLLKDGSALQVTVAQNVRADGSALPERVTPTVEVSDDLETINRTGVDAVLERAIGALKP